MRKIYFFVEKYGIDLTFVSKVFIAKNGVDAMNYIFNDKDLTEWFMVAIIDMMTKEEGVGTFFKDVKDKFGTSVVCTMSENYDDLVKFTRRYFCCLEDIKLANDHREASVRGVEVDMNHKCYYVPIIDNDEEEKNHTSRA